MGANALKHDCIRCGTELILGENWLECLARKKDYKCRDCDNLKRKLNYLKKKAKDGQLSQKDLASLRQTEALQGYNSTSKGDVYIISNPSFQGWVKVGRALQAENRLGDYQTSSPFRNYELHYFVTVQDRMAIERKAHKALEKQFARTNEWFYCSPEEAQKVIETLLK